MLWTNDTKIGKSKSPLMPNIQIRLYIYTKTLILWQKIYIRLVHQGPETNNKFRTKNKFTSNTTNQKHEP